MSNNSQNNIRIAKNSIFMSIRMLLVLAITFYSSRIILEALGVEDYGIYNAVGSIVALFTFLNTSLANGIQRFFNFELGRNGITGSNKVYNAALFIQILLAIILVIPIEIFGTWYINNKMVIPVDRLYAAGWIFQLSILTMVLHIIQVPYSAVVTAYERFDFTAIMSVMNATLTLIAAFIIPYLNGDSLIIYSIIIALIAAFNLITYSAYAKYHFKEVKLNLNLERSLLKNMLSFSGWNIFGTFGHLLKYQGTSLVLNFFFGPIINAAYGIANQVNSGIQGFVANITTPVRPQIIQSYSKGNITRTLNLTYSISKASCYVLLLISLPIIIEINYVLNIWLGNNVPTHTETIIILVILNSFLNNLNSCISAVVHASGIMRNYQLSGGVISLITIIFIYFVLSLFKIPEIAFIILIFLDCIRQVVAIIILKKIESSFSYYKYCNDVIRPIIIVSLSSLILPLTIYHYMDEGIIRFFIITFISFISATGSIYFFGLNKKERETTLHLLNSLKNKIFNK